MKQISFLFLLSLFLPYGICACTAFSLTAQDQSRVYCRSLEFGFRLDSELLVVPKGTQFTGTSAEGNPGIQWKSNYGYVGMNQSFAPTFVLDGMNEKGLVIGALYFLHFAHFQTPDPSKAQQTLGPWELPSYLLATCASIADVKETLKTLLIAQEPFSNMKFVLPLHYYVADAQGHTLVIEYVGGELQEHPNPIGVLTNSPAFEWHLTNLSNYVNLSPINITQLTLPDWTAKSFGQGSGLLGIPGDYTPPSRFVRAALFTSWAKKPTDSIDAVRTGFHILNTFDVVDGIVRPRKGSIAAKNDITEWVVVHDQTSLKTYFRGYNSLRIQMVDLHNIDFSRPGFQTIAIRKNFSVEDMTNKTKPLPPTYENIRH